MEGQRAPELFACQRDLACSDLNGSADTAQRPALNADYETARAMMNAIAEAVAEEYGTIRKVARAGTLDDVPHCDGSTRQRRRPRSAWQRGDVSRRQQAALCAATFRAAGSRTVNPTARPFSTKRRSFTQGRTERYDAPDSEVIVLHARHRPRAKSRGLGH